MFILALIIAAFIAFGLSFAIVGFLLVKSNDHGDSKGKIQDFDRGTFQMLASQNNIRKPR